MCFSMFLSHSKCMAIFIARKYQFWCLLLLFTDHRQWTLGSTVSQEKVLTVSLDKYACSTLNFLIVHICLFILYKLFSYFTLAFTINLQRKCHPTFISCLKSLKNSRPGRNVHFTTLLTSSWKEEWNGINVEKRIWRRQVPVQCTEARKTPFMPRWSGLLGESFPVSCNAFLRADTCPDCVAQIKQMDHWSPGF